MRRNGVVFTERLAEHYIENFTAMYDQQRIKK